MVMIWIHLWDINCSVLDPILNNQLFCPRSVEHCLSSSHRYLNTGISLVDLYPLPHTHTCIHMRAHIAATILANHTAHTVCVKAERQCYFDE